MQYQPVQSKIEPGMFDFKGEMLDIYSSTDKVLYRMFFDEDKLEQILVKDMFTFADKGSEQDITIWPATQYLQNNEDIEEILTNMNKELEVRVAQME